MLSGGAVDYLIDHERDLVIITFFGHVLPKHLLAMQGRARQDKDFRPDRAILFDLRSADLSGLGTDDIQRLTQSSPAAKGAPRAVVIGKEVQFGVARLFRTYMQMYGRHRTELFRSYDEALDWLDRRARG